MIYFMLLEEEFRRLGIRVEYVNGGYDDTDEGQLQKQIRAAIAEYERKKIIERSKRGKRGKARSGFVNVGARPPYGYRVKTEPHKQWLIIDDEEAVIVTMVFQWYTGNGSDGHPLAINAIKKRLTEMGIPTGGDKSEHVAKKQKHGIWTAGMVRHILTSETYIGTWHYGKTQIVKDTALPRRKPGKKQSMGTKQVPRPREEWIAVPVPAIIDRAIFEVAQQRLAKNPRFAAGRPAIHPYMLSRRLRCANCGYTMRGKTAGEHQYYVCNGQYKRLTECELPTFRGGQTDETVWKWLKDLLLHPEAIAIGIRAQQDTKAKATRPLQTRLHMIQDMLDDTDRQLSMLLDLYLERNVPKEMYLERKTQLDKRKEGLAQEKDDVEARLKVSTLSDEQVAEIEQFCADIREGLEGATFEDKLRYMELLDVHGTLSVENNERVIDLTCHLGKQRLALIPILPSSNTGATETTRSAYPSAARFR
jgi:site-specific DNA recombinase